MLAVVILNKSILSACVAYLPAIHVLGLIKISEIISKRSEVISRLIVIPKYLHFDSHGC